MLGPGVAPDAWEAASSGSSPSMPCCWKRRRSMRTVSGWVRVSWARCWVVRPAEHLWAEHFIAPLAMVPEPRLQLCQLVRLHPVCPRPQALKQGGYSTGGAPGHGADQASVNQLDSLTGVEDVVSRFAWILCA